MDSKDLRNIRTISEEVLQIEAASAEAGTGKYYREGEPTPQQLEVRAKQEKIKAASNRGKQYKEELSDEAKKLIESGIFTEEEIEAIIESEALAQKAVKRSQELGAKRRRREGVNRGMYKSERAGYNIAGAQRSHNASPETQGGPQTGGGAKPFGYAKHKENPIKSKKPAGIDTGGIGHSKYKQRKRNLGKDPSKNPKHDANK